MFHMIFAPVTLTFDLERPSSDSNCGIYTGRLPPSLIKIRHGESEKSWSHLEWVRLYVFWPLWLWPLILKDHIRTQPAGPTQECSNHVWLDRVMGKLKTLVSSEETDVQIEWNSLWNGDLSRRGSIETGIQWDGIYRADFWGLARRGTNETGV